MTAAAGPEQDRQTGTHPEENRTDTRTYRLISPHISETHVRRLLSKTSVCMCVPVRIRRSWCDLATSVVTPSHGGSCDALQRKHALHELEPRQLM